MANNVNINIEFEKITLGDNIGFGSYGNVFKGKWKTDDGEKKIAIKQFKNSCSDTDVNKEFEALCKLKHKNIVTVYGISTDKNNIIHILLEYADGGSVFNFLHISANQISYIGKINWMRQCAKALAYLHEKNIAHRDFKTQNILLFDNFLQLKLCDFGCVKKIATKNTEVVGTCLYMAPEVGNTVDYNTKCDVFSYGIVFWEVMSRLKPYHHLDIHDLAILRKVVDERLRPSLDEIKGYRNSNHIKSIISQCWDHDPEKRPTMKGLGFTLGLDPESFDDNTKLITQVRPLPEICEKDFRLQKKATNDDGKRAH